MPRIDTRWGGNSATLLDDWPAHRVSGRSVARRDATSCRFVARRMFESFLGASESPFGRSGWLVDACL